MRNVHARKIGPREGTYGAAILLENKTDLQVETRGASLDAEKQLNLQPKYHTDTYKWHTNKRPLQVDVAGASKDAPVNRKF